jgi:hypothetical protein
MERKSPTQRRLIPDPQVCRDRYHIHSSTLRNWDCDPLMGFPKAVRIRNRKYRDERELDEFDAARAAERQTEPAP